MKLFILALCVCTAFAGEQRGRDGKFLSLFNIVTFKNEACTAASDNTMQGTCFTTTECQDKGGTVDGNCASGFGVCCVFTTSTCGGTISNNCTYIQNEGYPTGSTTLQTCTWTFSRICDDLCNIRLDFDNFVLTQPTTLTGVCSSAGDTAVATSPSGTSPPTVCGTLTGQHMYIDPGTTGNAGTFAITTATATTSRTYKVKVSYIQCSNLAAAPRDCTQYYTGVSNTITSYNHQGGQQLDDQNYAVCMRQEAGYCQYDLAQSASTTPDPFQLRDRNNAAAVTAPVAAKTGTDCAKNYISFPIENTANGNLRCGELLAVTEATETASAVRSQATTPFVINYFSELDTAITVTSGVTTGFNLEYTQVPC